MLKGEGKKRLTSLYSQMKSSFRKINLPFQQLGKPLKIAARTRLLLKALLDPFGNIPECYFPRDNVLAVLTDLTMLPNSQFDEA